MSEIFISYRRDDSAGYAGRLFDHLKAVFGPERIFLDVDDIQPGQVFADVIQKRIAGCAVAIVVIGKRWLETLRARAGEDTDYVSTEIVAALKSSAVVIPVLVGGASMPKAADLPGSLSRSRWTGGVRDPRHDLRGRRCLPGDRYKKCARL